jgi:hypothetical protein
VAASPFSVQSPLSCCAQHRYHAQLPCEAEDGRGFSDTWHARDDHVRHVAIFGDDLEALNRFGIADNIVKVNGTIFFYPLMHISQDEL